MKNPLIIAGSAPCVNDDLAAIPEHGRFDFMLIGAGSPATLNIRILSYHASHEDDFTPIRDRRLQNGLNVDYKTISNHQYPDVDIVLPEMTPPTCSYDCRPRLQSRDPRNHHHYSGTSAMLGLKAGLRLGYRKIILAGVPIDEGHYAHFQVGWLWIVDLLVHCPVRSMSGYTRHLLGKYTEEWLNG
jgi:hypothetical protein